MKDPAAFGKAGKITGAHHYKCDVLVSQEAFGKRIAEDKIKVAWLQQGSCLIYAKTIQRQGSSRQRMETSSFSPQNRQQ